MLEQRAIKKRKAGNGRVGNALMVARIYKPTEDAEPVRSGEQNFNSIGR